MLLAQLGTDACTNTEKYSERTFNDTKSTQTQTQYANTAVAESAEF